MFSFNLLPVDKIADKNSETVPPTRAALVDNEDIIPLTLVVSIIVFVFSKLALP